MSRESLAYRRRGSRSDRARLRNLPLPQGVVQRRNLCYGPYGIQNLLDVYYPEGTTAPLPTIVSFHGGGYVAGSKAGYKHYCMDLARRGFAVVNYNYRLAPRWKFPVPIYDTNRVLGWIGKHGTKYFLDPERVILIGDSAGAQQACQYAAIATNPEFARLYRMEVAPVPIRVLGLNCGRYDLKDRVSEVLSPRHQDFWGKQVDTSDPIYDVMAAITEDFPPAYIATGYHDGLMPYAEPMYDFLTAKGIPCAVKIYGSPEETKVGHDFHIDTTLPQARQCNDEECDFFRHFV